MPNNFSPKIELIQYFDNLINQVDIHFEECLQNYQDEQNLRDLECFKVKNRTFEHSFRFEYFESYESIQMKRQNGEENWSEETKVSDYLNQVRMKTIEILRKGQNESLENLKSKSFNSDKLKEAKNINEFKSHLFSDKFYFQVIYKSSQRKKWVFNLFTFVTDFYISSSDIDLLEYNYFN